MWKMLCWNCIAMHLDCDMDEWMLPAKYLRSAVFVSVGNWVGNSDILIIDIICYYSSYAVLMTHGGGDEIYWNSCQEWIAKVCGIAAEIPACCCSDMLYTKLWNKILHIHVAFSGSARCDRKRHGCYTYTAQLLDLHMSYILFNKQQQRTRARTPAHINDHIHKQHISQWSLRMSITI